MAKKQEAHQKSGATLWSTGRGQDCFGYWLRRGSWGFSVIEMNASDTRSEKAINAVAKPATSYRSLDNFSGGRQNPRQRFVP